MRGIAVIKPGAPCRRRRLRHPEPMSSASATPWCADFCGHGLGRIFHDAPNILHFGRPGDGPVLKPGMFFTVEPMINRRPLAGERSATAGPRSRATARSPPSSSIRSASPKPASSSSRAVLELIKPPYDLGETKATPRRRQRPFSAAELNIEATRRQSLTVAVVRHDDGRFPGGCGGDRDRRADKSARPARSRSLNWPRRPGFRRKVARHPLRSRQGSS